MLRVLLTSALLLLVACAGPSASRAEPQPVVAPVVPVMTEATLPPPPVEAPPPAEVLPPPPTVGEQIAEAASQWVGVRSLRKLSRRVTDDCSGLVRLAFTRTGHELELGDTFVGGSAAKEMHLQARRRGALRYRRPEVGDLVFFRNTYDRNHDGRRNDGVTHVGIVERVDEDGTVSFIHRGGKGVARARMSLIRPSLRKDPEGKVVNDFVRRIDRTRAPRLAGQLFAGFASPDLFAGERTLSTQR